MGLVNGVEDSWVASVVRVLHSVSLEGKRQVVNVRHLQGDLKKTFHTTRYRYAQGKLGKLSKLSGRRM